MERELDAIVMTAQVQGLSDEGFEAFVKGLSDPNDPDFKSISQAERGKIERVVKLEKRRRKEGRLPLTLMSSRVIKADESRELERIRNGDIPKIGDIPMFYQGCREEIESWGAIINGVVFWLRYTSKGVLPWEWKVGMVGERGTGKCKTRKEAVLNLKRVKSQIM